MTKRIGLFVEDYGHETVLKALIRRYAQEDALVEDIDGAIPQCARRAWAYDQRVTPVSS